MKLQTTVNIQAQLTLKNKHQLFELFRSYYDNVNFETFQNDLSEKDLVIRIWNGSTTLMGFSTIRLIWLPVDGIQHLFLYSGDTIIREQARSPYELSGAFIHIMFALNAKYSSVPQHWFLISKGFRTYRFLSLYFKEFYPRYDKPIPYHEKKLLDTVATYKFGNQYDAANQLIRYQNSKDYLNAEYACIPEGRLNDPHVSFFLKKNPLYYTGEELACITDLNPENYKEIVYRIKKASNLTLMDIEL